jgi:hypothetical protein
VLSNGLSHMAIPGTAGQAGATFWAWFSYA